MIIRAWRIVKGRYLNDAFSGEGSRLAGSRWTSKGIRVVYASESISLAALEVMANAPSYEILKNYFCVPVDFDLKLVRELKASDLPDNLRKDPPSAELKKLGDEWALKEQSVILKVPSAIITQESNYIINVMHPDFRKVKIGVEEPFSFDPRLKNG